MKRKTILKYTNNKKANNSSEEQGKEKGKNFLRKLLMSM